MGLAMDDMQEQSKLNEEAKAGFLSARKNREIAADMIATLVSAAVAMGTSRYFREN
jgi:hypothetical protein